MTQRQPTSTYGRLIHTGVAGIYRRDAKFIVRWSEEGRRRARSFPSMESACAFQRDYVVPYRTQGALPPTALTPRSGEEAGWVYFFRSQGPDRLVKIGWSRDPGERLRTLTVAHPFGLALVALLPGERPLERRLHEAFAEWRRSGEWFSREVLDVLAERLTSG